MSDFSSDLARGLADDVRDRFVRYARIDTQAKPGTDEVPSTQKQLDLSRLLVDELSALGAEDVEIDEHGIVFATIPATADGEVSVIGFLAHVDTSPDAPSSNINPQVTRYEGGKLPLPADPDVALDPEESLELAHHVGHEIVTTDGTTLLGADDKAGVAAIMTATKHLLAHPEIPHGKLRVAFTTDEEVGHGARFFDIERFGARCAYTIDGSTAGEIEDETFSAAEVVITFHGFGIHPGYAKDRLVNAVKLANDFLTRLPDGEGPEDTDGRQGYVHPTGVQGTVDRVEVHLIVRDFETKVMHEGVEQLRELAEAAVEGVSNARIEFNVEIQYLNMKDHLDEVPEVVEAAMEAIRRAGLTPKCGSIRGGTDGSLLTAKGLPTPNIFNGAQDFHSVKEWVCVHDMAASAATIIELARVWAEEPYAPS